MPDRNVAISRGSRIPPPPPALSPDRAQQYLYVADIINQIHILDRVSLKVLASFGKGGTAPGEFGTVHELAADSKGNLYTAELRTHRVQKFVFKGIS